MKHLKEALNYMIPKGVYGVENTHMDHPVQFIDITTHDHSVNFQIQDGPIKEVGVNGCQASDMLEFVKNLFQSLNNSFPCRENALTITKLEEAIHWQDARTKDREKRDVEGKSKL